MVNCAQVSCYLMFYYYFIRCILHCVIQIQDSNFEQGFITVRS